MHKKIRWNPYSSYIFFLVIFFGIAFPGNLLAETLYAKSSKTKLQEKLYARGLSEPDYRIVDELGPDHEKEFVVAVYIQDRFLTRARGGSKKEAQQTAAGQALERLDEFLNS